MRVTILLDWMLVVVIGMMAICCCKFGASEAAKIYSYAENLLHKEVVLHSKS
jgi:hypothetical protein